jgi:hypothetical protein
LLNYKIIGKNCKGEFIYWGEVEKNPSLLLQLQDVHWKWLSANSNAIRLLLKNTDKIDYEYLCLNRNIHAMQLLNNKKICLPKLFQNPTAIDFIEDYFMNKYDNIDNYEKEMFWFHLSYNPAIFTYDYEYIKYNRRIINESIMKELYSPKRLMQWLNNDNDLEKYMN